MTDTSQPIPMPPAPQGAPHVLADPAEPRAAAEAVLFEIRRVIVGQDAMLERVLVALLAGGHLLLEGVPGLAKTLTIRTLADALDASFRRIQFTPDLVPADLVGTRIYRPSSGTFDTELGPVFSNFLLADEINRAPAKVQSALLEVMQERQVTIGRETHRVPSPFLVMATQNPIESEGTYPLPEAQVDRFMMKVVVGYPSDSEEATVVERSLRPAPEVRDGARHSLVGRVPGGDARDLRRSGDHRLRGLDRGRDPPAGALRAGGAQALHRVRRQPARLDQPRACGPCAGPAPRPPLRRSRPTSPSSPRTFCAIGSCPASRPSPRRCRPTPSWDSSFRSSPRLAS